MTFDFDNMDIKIEKNHEQGFEYTYNDKRYLYKKSKNGDFLYELLAEKIAKKLSIPCCHYILTYDDGIANISSEMFDTRNYISLRELLKEVYGKVTYFGLLDEKRTDYLYKSKNDLEDIWFALDKKYGLREDGQELVSKLMQDIVRIFLFDAVIANSDRHTENIGFIDDGKNVELAPLFDNDYMLSECALYDNDYSMFVESGDYFERQDYADFATDEEPSNSLEKFFNISASEYKSDISEMLNVTSRESLEEIFNELEKEGVPIPSEKREGIISKFELNNNIIRNMIKGKRVI